MNLKPSEQVVAQKACGDVPVERLADPITEDKSKRALILIKYQVILSDIIGRACLCCPRVRVAAGEIS